MKIFYLLALLAAFHVHGQSWQWGKRGGGDGALGDINNTERVKAIATDSQGNVYALCTVSALNLDVDGTPRTGCSQPATSDYVITSFDCQGNYRWSKVIGGYSSDNLNGLAVDSENNIYVTGRVLPTTPGVATVNFDSDFSLEQSASNNIQKKGLFILKYSSEGILQWSRWPQPDNVTIADNAQTFSLALSVDTQGNSWWFVRLRPGLYNGGYSVTTTDSFHVLKYDNDGNFLGGLPIDITSAQTATIEIRMAVNDQSGVIYLAGSVYPIAGESVTINGTAVTSDMYLAAFDPAGQYLWHKQGSQILNAGEGFEDILVNETGDIYLLGATLNGMVFDTYTFSSSSGSVFPFVIKTDGNGNVIWGTNGIATAQSQVFSITEGAMTGGFGGTLT